MKNVDNASLDTSGCPWYRVCETIEKKVNNFPLFHNYVREKITNEVNQSVQQMCRSIHETITTVSSINQTIYILYPNHRTPTFVYTLKQLEDAYEKCI